MPTFDDVGIRYLTPASIMLFRECPAAWVLRHLFGKQKGGKPAFARSIAMKDGTKVLAYRGDFDEAVWVAQQSYARQLERMRIDPGGEGPRSEQDAILPMLRETCKAFLEAGLDELPIAADLVSSVWLSNDLTAPFLSVPHLIYPDVQIQVRYTHRCPTKIQPRHMMALAVDQRLREQAVGIIYVTTKKNSGLMLPRPGELEQAQADMEFDAMALQTFLGSVESREHALAMVPLNPDTYQWTPELLLEARLIIHNAKDHVDGIIRAKRAGISEGPSWDAHGNLLSDYRSGDAENDL